MGKYSKSNLVLHHMHIPKTGGTAIRMILKKENTVGQLKITSRRFLSCNIFFEQHDYNLQDVPNDEKVFLV